MLLKKLARDMFYEASYWFSGRLQRQDCADGRRQSGKSWLATRNLEYIVPRQVRGRANLPIAIPEGPS
jgi:hypothetical protein